MQNGSCEAEPTATEKIMKRDIETVLKAFNDFHSLCENENFFRNPCKEDIKDYFKLAIFIEKSMTDFKSKNCAEQFVAILKTNCLKMYSLEFYCFACDHVLTEFFKQKSLKPNVIDVALRMYTALLPKERLEIMLKEFILTSVSSKTILDYFVANKNMIDGNELEAHILLKYLAKDCELQNTLENMLCHYKLQSSLPRLIKVLCIKTEEVKEDSVKKHIFDVLLEKMMDRSILTQNFWSSIFKNVNPRDLAVVCEKNQDFFLQLSKFIIYLGSMMICVQNADGGKIWKGDPKLSICPEITFDEMLLLIRSLKNHNDNHKNYLRQVFKDACEKTHLLIWEEFERNYIDEFL